MKETARKLFTAYNLASSLEGSQIQKYSIDCKTEFWAHCSNLQKWGKIYKP